MGSPALSPPRPATAATLAAVGALLILGFARTPVGPADSPGTSFPRETLENTPRGGNGGSMSPVVDRPQERIKKQSPAAAGPALAAGGAPRDPEARINEALQYTIMLEGDGIYGSGFVVDPARGLATTAWHVVADMKSPRATYYDGRVVSVKLLASDKKLDLALLQLPPNPALRAPVLGDVTRLSPGDEVFAVGAPRKLGFTVSRGIVSFVGRTMEGARYLQADMSINDGNSGGPVITARGEIVGMMSFIYRRAQGLSFALPVNYVVERFADRILAPDMAARAAYLARFRIWKASNLPGPLRDDAAEAGGREH